MGERHVGKKKGNNKEHNIFGRQEIYSIGRKRSHPTFSGRWVTLYASSETQVNKSTKRVGRVG